jgi:hypothetical protein
MKKLIQPAPTWAFVLLAGLLSSCSLQKEVELDLPEPQRRLVVESYLQPGQPFLLALQQEAGYFEPIDQKPSAPPATVTIRYDTTTITLQELDAATIAQIADFLGPDAPQFLQQYSSLGYVRLYFSNLLETSQLVPEKYDTDFHLRVEDSTGRVVTATTRIPRAVPIDSLKTRANEKGKHYVLTFAADNGNETNYYRRILRSNAMQYDTLRDATGTITGVDSASVQRINQDFISNDDIFNGGTIVFGTGYDYEKGDTIQSELYHITKEYYNFIESSQFAQQANGNPFGQPAVIKSNVVGGLGIFTGYVPAIKTLVVE